MKQNLLILISASFVVLGCGHDDHDHDHGSDHSTAEEACEHMTEKSSTQTTAGATEKDAANTSKDDWLHRRNEVTLTADGKEFVGFVTLEVGKAGTHNLFANHPVDVTIGKIAPASSSSVDECTDVESGYAYDLPIGEHVMAIRADQEKVSFVLEFPADKVDGHDH